MNFDELLQFVERDTRMAHVYQPIMLLELLSQNGRASIADIARSLLNEDRSQIEYYSEITRNMVGRVLTNRNVVKRDGAGYLLLGYENLTPDQVHCHLHLIPRPANDNPNPRGGVRCVIPGMADFGGHEK